jgi:hypothetical protein
MEASNYPDLVQVDKYTFIKYDESTKIVFKIHEGVLNVNDSIQSWLSIIQKQLIPQETIGYIIDYRNARFVSGIESSKTMTEVFNGHPKYFKGKKIALITNEPHMVVMLLIVQTFENKIFDTQPFNTEEAAIEWISKNT